MQEKKAIRHSNIELLRIVAALLVIILHYNNKAFGSDLLTSGGGINKFILIAAESLSICAVNVFVIISGYFMCRNNARDLLKPISLIFRVVFFALASLAVMKVMGKGSGIFDDLVGLVFNSNWYVFVFAALYLISPYINLAWNALDNRGRRLLLIISLLVFSVYPTALDMISYWSGRQLMGSSTVGIEGTQAGYTIVNFVVLYLIGAYIRDMDGKNFKSPAYCFGFYILMAAVIVVLTCVDGMRSGQVFYNTVSWNYSNPIVIAEATALFMCFAGIGIKDSRIINTLSGAAFTVYILHLRFIGLFGIEKFAGENPLLLLGHLIMTIAAIYAICFVIHIVYSAVFSKIAALISDRWVNFRKYSV